MGKVTSLLRLMRIVSFLAAAALMMLLFFAALTLPDWLRGEIQDLLDDLAHDVCTECEVEIGQIEFDWLSLEALGRDIHIVRGDVKEIEAKEVRVKLGLTQIFQGRIDLKKLSLIEARARGFLPGSVLYGLIAGEEQQDKPRKPGLFKAVLHHLAVRSGRISEEFGERRLFGDNLELDLIRQDKDTMNMAASVERVQLLHQSTAMELGGIAVNGSFEDDRITLGRILVALGESRIDAAAVVEGELIRGSFTHRLAAETFNLPFITTGVLAGEGRLSGTLDTPAVEGSIHLSEDLPLLFTDEVAPPISMDFFEAKYSAALRDEKIDAVVPYLRGDGNAAIEVLEPLTLKNGRLAGQIRVAAQEIALQELRLSDLSGVFQVAGTLEDPRVSLQGETNAAYENLDLNRISVTADYSSSRLSLALEPTLRQFATFKGELLFGEEIVVEQAVLIAKDWLIRDDLLLRGKISVSGPLDPGRLKLSADVLATAADLFPEPTDFKGLLELQGGQLSGEIQQLGVEEGGRLDLKGQISAARLDLTAKGSLAAESIAQFFQGVDLQGTAAIDISVQGSLQALNFWGTLVLENGLLYIDDPPLALEDINLEIALRGLTGTIKADASAGSGRVSVTGELNLSELENSELLISMDGAEVISGENISAIVSGELLLQRLAAIPRLTGRINIDQAQYEADVNFRNIGGLVVDLLRRGVARYGGATEPGGRSDNGDLNVEFDLRINAAGGIFVSTDWSEAELQVGVRISGTSLKPVIDGSLEILWGEFYIGENRFEVIRGAIFFNPRERVETIELQAETSAITPPVGRTIITLSVSGPVDNPQINLSSDAGLSQRDLILLVTGGGGIELDDMARALGETRVARRARILKRFPPLRLLWEVGELARPDRVQLDPGFNPDTGAVEPRILAEKRIASRLSLEGEQSLVGEAATAIFRLIYELTDRLNLISSLSSLPESEDPSVGLKAEYLIVPPRRFLELRVRGNQHISERALLEKLHISPHSRLTLARAARLPQQTLRIYREEGFFSVEVSGECIDQLSKYCRAVEISIHEGPRAVISNIVFKGDPLPAHLKRELDLPNVGDPATAAGLQRSEAQLRRILREAGYLRSRVNTQYSGEMDEHPELVIDLTLHRKVDFKFTGNEAFDREELLQTLRIDDRRIPFGRNIPQLLAANIESLYSGYGFSGTQVSHKRLDDIDDQDLYLFTIDEGQPMQVDEVVIEGLEQPISSQLYRSMTGPQRRAVLSPRIYMPRDAREAVAVMESLLRELGFDQAAVSYETVGVENDAVNLVYHVKLGPQTLFQNVEVSGMPEGLQKPKKPDTPAPLSQLQSFVSDLKAVLREQGFNRAEVSLKVESDKSGAAVIVKPGEPTIISQIIISGLENVGRDVVLQALTVSAGDRWDQRELRRSRERLVRLGLFMNVDFEPGDGVLDPPAEELLIHLSERNLRSLSAGIGVESEYGMELSLNGIDRSPFKDGRSISADMHIFYEPTVNEITRGTAVLRYQDPNFRDTEYQLTEALGFQQLTRSVQEYNLQRYSLTSVLAREFQGGLSHSIGHNLFFDNLSEVPQDAVLSSLDSGDIRLSMLIGGVSVGDGADPVMGESTTSANLKYRLSAEWLGSEANYLGVEPRASFVYPLEGVFHRVSLANVTAGGATWTFDGTSQVPISQRYYLGGRNQVRGFKENSLGPLGEAGSVQGGDLYFMNSSEIRYFPAERFYLLSFLDAGNVFLQSGDGRELRTSSGVGLRYISPVGSIGLDWAVPLDRKEGESTWQIHFSIGATF